MHALEPVDVEELDERHHILGFRSGATEDQQIAGIVRQHGTSRHKGRLHGIPHRSRLGEAQGNDVKAEAAAVPGGGGQMQDVRRDAARLVDRQNAIALRAFEKGKIVKRQNVLEHRHQTVLGDGTGRTRGDANVRAGIDDVVLAQRLSQHGFDHVA